MGKRAKPAEVPRDPHGTEVGEALERVRATLAKRGLLLLQDAELPSATTVIVGEPVRGSWWGHPQNKLIYDTLQQFTAEVLWVKLVRGKETLVAPTLWPALLGVACSREPWQLDGLTAPCQRLLALVDSTTEPVRLDQVTLPAPGKPLRELARELERRLLVHGDELHTESGKHVKVLESWTAWQRAREISKVLPAAKARSTLEAAVKDWPKPRLPWQT